MALAALRQQGGPLQQALLPALTFQVTRLTSLAGLAEQRWHPAPAATAAAACSGASGLLLGSSLLSSGRPSRPGGGSGLQLILPGQQLQPAVQQRPIFNFAGLGGDLSKRHHERKLLGCVLLAMLCVERLRGCGLLPCPVAALAVVCSVGSL